jgi:hypothetical protein
MCNPKKNTEIVTPWWVAGHTALDKDCEKLTWSNDGIMKDGGNRKGLREAIVKYNSKM